MEQETHNKTIAKNTGLLFIRMCFMMGVTLYTSRVVLNSLGVDDFGIYNVVGGVVGLLSILSGCLTNASSRFVTFYVGKNNYQALTEMYGSVRYLFIGMCVVIILLGETVGLWLVTQKLVIPAERFNAALWVYHCSIVTTIISLLALPYVSLVQAYEKMGTYAWITILDVTLKLAVAISLSSYEYDKLKLFSALTILTQAVILVIYNRFCNKKIEVCKEKLICNYGYLKQITKYACWSLTGFVSIMGYTQGLNILLNIFFYPAINAARGIASQVQSAAQTLVENFLLAMRPQIIKSYANGNIEYMHELVIASSKYGFLLILLICLPLSLFLEPILKLWLGVVPDYTSDFIRYIIMISLIQPFRQSMINGIHATGDIKKFQIWEGFILLLILPIAYILLSLFKCQPTVVFAVHLLMEAIAQLVRFIIVLTKIGLSKIYYFKKAIFPIIPFVGTLYIYKIIPFMINISFTYVIMYGFLADIVLILLFFLFSLTSEEKSVVLKITIKIMKTLKINIFR